MKTVASRYDEYVSVKELTDKINRALTAAKKDNDFIYHDRVPEVKDLEPIGKAALVKATAITPPLSQKFTGTMLKHILSLLSEFVKLVSEIQERVTQTNYKTLQVLIVLTEKFEEQFDILENFKTAVGVFYTSVFV